MTHSVALGKTAELGEETGFHQGPGSPSRYKACFPPSPLNHKATSPLFIHALSPNKSKWREKKKKDFKFTFNIAYAFWSSFQLHLSNIVLQAKVLYIVSSGDCIYKQDQEVK